MNFLVYKPVLQDAVERFKSQRDSLKNLKANLEYQIVIARLIFFRKKDALPDAKDIDGMAEYWKTHYNTYMGKGTVAEAIENYKRYVING